MSGIAGCQDISSRITAPRIFDTCSYPSLRPDPTAPTYAKTGRAAQRLMNKKSSRFITQTVVTFLGTIHSCSNKLSNNWDMEGGNTEKWRYSMITCICRRWEVDQHGSVRVQQTPYLRNRAHRSLREYTKSRPSNLMRMHRIERSLILNFTKFWVQTVCIIIVQLRLVVVFQPEEFPYSSCCPK